MNILASFGMWLTRRFGSVRPGEVLIPKGAVVHIEIVNRTPSAAEQFSGDQVAIALIAELMRKFASEFYGCGDLAAANIMASARAYLEGRGTRTEAWGTVTCWWLRDTVGPLLAGRDTPHEATKPTEAKPL